MTTAYITHPTFLLHDMGPEHPEQPLRLTAIEKALKSTGLFDKLLHFKPNPASREDIERVHAPSYVLDLHARSPRTGLTQLDADTALCPHSLEAAYLSAGAVVKGIDLVLEQKVSNAFCAVRPPGHHAERAQAMGFCFFGSISVGAAYALSKPNVDRVAIFDFDVHHGNGTEDLIGRNSGILFGSTFQHPFYPHRPFAKDNPQVINMPLPAGTGGDEFRATVEQNWCPAVSAFKPDLILISAGFDAHRDDSLGQFQLTENDFTWITELLLAQAEEHCAGRVVSLLEGGYHLESLGRCVSAHIECLIAA